MDSQNIVVLLVEDNPAHAELAKRSLEKSDLKCTLLIEEYLENAQDLLEKLVWLSQSRETPETSRAKAWSRCPSNHLRAWAAF